MRKLLVGVVLLSGIALGFFLTQGKWPWEIAWPWGKTEEPSTTPKKTTIVYQWRDESGRLQMSNELPPEGVEYTVVEAKGNLSSMGPLPTAGKHADTAAIKDRPMESLSGFVRDASSAADGANETQQQNERLLKQNQ